MSTRIKVLKRYGYRTLLARTFHFVSHWCWFKFDARVVCLYDGRYFIADVLCDGAADSCFYGGFDATFAVSLPLVECAEDYVCADVRRPQPRTS